MEVKYNYRIIDDFNIWFKQLAKVESLIKALSLNHHKDVLHF